MAPEQSEVRKGVPVYQHLRTSANRPRYHVHVVDGTDPWIQVSGAALSRQRAVRKQVPNPALKAFRYLGVHLELRTEPRKLEAVQPVLGVRAILRAGDVTGGWPWACVWGVGRRNGRGRRERKGATSTV